MPFAELPAGDDDDSLFQLSLMGMVAKELGMVAMMWEFQDERLYFTGEPQALGPLAPCMTMAEFRAAVHPDDVALLDASLARCQASETTSAELCLRLADGHGWQRLTCRFRLSERDETGQPARLVGMLLPAAGDAGELLHH